MPANLGKICPTLFFARLSALVKLAHKLKGGFGFFVFFLLGNINDSIAPSAVFGEINGRTDSNAVKHGGIISKVGNRYDIRHSSISFR